MSRAYSPGRVNLMGDHTDYTGGFALPMAIDLGTTVELVRDGPGMEVTTDAPAKPGWSRYVTAVMAEMGIEPPVRGHVSTSLPLGAGLSSSAALEVATALALGHAGPVMELAQLCQRAETAGSGVPCGLMDQLSCAAGKEGSGLLIDFGTEEFRYVTIPANVAIWVLHSGVARSLGSSEYAIRRQECAAAAEIIGPLRDATASDLGRIDDLPRRRRARHVIAENLRVLDFAEALESGDSRRAGELMEDSHRSLRDDFEVSHPALDDLVASLCSTPGVHGARLTGAGFGGCVVAVTEPEVQPGTLPDAGAGIWRVRPSAGAHRI
jgi:galactokinase